MASLVKRKYSYFIRFYLNGKQFERTLKTDNLKLAEKRYAQYCQALDSNKEIGLDSKFINVFDSYFVELEITERESVIKEKTKRVHHIIEFFEERRIGDITKSDILDFVAYMNKLKLAYETQRKIMLVLKAFFRWAADSDQSYIFEDPSRNVKIKKEKKKSFRILSFEELQIFIESTNEIYPELREIFTVIYLTGARPNEIASLRWHDVLLKTNPPAIRIISSKTDSGRRVIPMTPLCCDIIKSLPKDSQYVFPDLNKRKEDIEDFWNINKLSKRAKRIFDINQIQEANLYSLRHTSATYSLLADKDIYSLSRKLGHSSVKTTEIYLHLAPMYVTLDINTLDDTLCKTE